MPIAVVHGDNFYYKAPAKGKTLAAPATSPSSLSSFRSSRSSFSSRGARMNDDDSDASDEDSDCDVRPLTFEQANPSPSPEADVEYVISEIDGCAYPKGSCPEDEVDQLEEAVHEAGEDDQMEVDVDPVEHEVDPVEDEVDQLLAEEVDQLEEERECRPFVRARSSPGAYRTPPPYRPSPTPEVPYLPPPVTDTPYRPPPRTYPSYLIKTPDYVEARRRLARVPIAPEPDTDEEYDGDCDDGDVYTPEQDVYMDDAPSSKPVKSPRKPPPPRRSRKAASPARNTSSGGSRKRKARSPSPAPTGPPQKRKRQNAASRNRQVDEETWKRAKQVKRKDDLWQCTICKKRMVRRPDFLRHVDTHYIKLWACLGVPVKNREDFEVPEEFEEYGPSNNRRVGGCFQICSRRDAMLRHLNHGRELKKPIERCYGSPYMLEKKEREAWLPFIED